MIARCQKLVEKEIVNNIENNDYFIWYDRTEIENLIKDKSFTWYSTVYCTFYSKPNFLWNPYKECFSLRIPLAWLCEHTNDNYIKEKISNEYKENIIDFKNYKIEGKNIDGLFSRSFSQISSKNLADYIRFLSRDTTYNVVNDYGQQRNYTAEEIRTNFEDFVSRYFSNKNKLYDYEKAYKKTYWLDNVISLREIFKLYILFTAASIGKEDTVFEQSKLHINDAAVTGILEKILNIDRDMTSVFMIDNIAYASQNSFYLERLYSILVLNLQFSIDDFLEIVTINQYIDDYLNQMFCFNTVINNEIRRLTPVCQFNYETLKNITAPKISFIILINVLCKRKYLNINYKILNTIKENHFINKSFEKIYALRDIVDKIDDYYKHSNYASQDEFLDNLFKNNKILSFKDQNLILDFILPEHKEYKQKKQKVNLFYRHIEYIKSIYIFIKLKRKIFTVNFFDIFYLSFIYFRLYKNNLPVLKQYQTKRNYKKIDGVWKKIITNKGKVDEWLDFKYGVTLFELYYMVWEDIKDGHVDDSTFDKYIKKIMTEQLENYYFKIDFLDSIIKNLKIW